MNITWKESYGFSYDKETLNRYSEDRNRKGVYMIWRHSNGKVIYVGSGDIDRLWDHLNENWPSQYSDLVANYAIIEYWRGIERYLADKYRPLIGDRYPADVDPIEVNTPGE